MLRQRLDLRKCLGHLAPALCLWALTGGPISGQSGRPLFGLQPFPYDVTWSALDHVHSLAGQNGSIAVVHRDNGIPWAQAFLGTPWPAAFDAEWDELARRVPPGRPVYLALAPLAVDRVSLAPAHAESWTPSQIAGAPFDAPAVKMAYLNYARRAVARFRPQYLNLGIEAGEIAARAPDKWPAFAALFHYVQAQLKAEYPGLQIGISFGLPSLMQPDVAARVRPLVEASDYLGLSFYPYMSAFYERFGAAPLPPVPRQWRDPLAWVARYTSRPVALVETAYSAADVYLPRYNLHLEGSPDYQAQYVADLGQIAQRNRYLFVVWAIPVDYDALYSKLPAGDGAYALWLNTGLLDANLEARPAWSAWLHAVAQAPVVPHVEGGPPASEPEPMRPAGTSNGR